MATAHASVYISSRILGDTPIDSIQCRSRRLARHKRTSDCLWMAAPSSFGDSVGGANPNNVEGASGGLDEQDGQYHGGSAVGGMPIWEYSSNSNERQHDNGVRALNLVGQEGGDVESRGDSSSGIILTSIISARRGITMDSVQGSVRSKAPPVATAPQAANENAFVMKSLQMPSMIELSAAVEEAAKQTPSVSSTGRNDVDTVMDTEPIARNYRATSSIVLLKPLLNDGSDVPKPKRAKSGVSLTESGDIASAPSTAGGSVGWFGDTRPHQTSSISSGIDVTALSGAKRSPERVKSSGVGGSGGELDGDAGGNSAESFDASGDPPLTNERWLEMLTPLLSMFKPGTHPEDYLHELLRERGYSTEMVAVKETAFHRPPHPDQVASYDKVILRAVLDNDEGALERMRASGKRMDCCNRFGDSVLHMSCRRGRVGALRYLLRVCPSGVLLTDDFGRTIMHDACWTATPRFDVASAVLDVDLRLLRCLDSRGSSPLQYVPQDQWPYWCAFFENRKDLYWPPLAPGERDVVGEIPLAEGVVAGE